MADMFEVMTRRWKNIEMKTDREQSEIEKERRMLMEDSEDDSYQL
jgi:hypothetical protein